MMDFIVLLCYVYVFVIGLCVASFINVVIYRVPNKMNFVSGRSFCPNCGNTLKPYDMIPVFSWLFLKGKCRFCKASISIRYPIVEFIGAILATLIFHHYGFTWFTPVVFVFSMVLLATAFIDFDTMEIPNGIVIFLLLYALLFIVIDQNLTVFDRFIGFFSASLPMVLINCIVKDSFGGGDIKLMAVCGIILGWQNTVFAMFIAILLAGCYGMYLIITKKVEKGAHIAFGPYLCVGIFIAMLYGNAIIQIYLSVFGF